MNLYILLLRNKPKIHLLNPKKSKLVIYDPLVRDEFKNLVSSYDPTYLALSSEIYLPILFKTFVTKMFGKDQNLVDLYIKKFLSYVNPVLIGTNFEIDCRFAYFVSNLGWNTFFVQHGYYTQFFVNEDYRSKFREANVTDMFVFNNGVKSNLQLNYKYQGNFHAIGSVGANALINRKICSNSKNKNLYFVSEWEGAITKPQYLLCQDQIIQYCAKYAQSHFLKLKILLRFNENHPDYEKEKAFYVSATAGNVEFVAKKTEGTNYKVISDAYGVIFLSSTLGYELLLNYNLAVGCIAYRSLFPGQESWVFGWPTQTESRGIGFTNIIDYEEISRVLDDLRVGGISKVVRENLLEYDCDNKILKAFLYQKLSAQYT